MACIRPIYRNTLALRYNSGTSLAIVINDKNVIRCRKIVTNWKFGVYYDFLSDAPKLVHKCICLTLNRSGNPN